MGVGSILRKLGLFLEEVDEAVGTVTSVEFADRLDPKTGSAAEIELTIPLSSIQELFSPSEATVASDGQLRFTLASAPLVPTTDSDFEVEATGATIDDETVTVVLTVSVASEGDSTEATDFGPNERSSDAVAVADEADDATTADRERDVPPFRDPELLADVYESCDTFTEMSEVIEMDVTAETVRRYMIDYGIHEPNSYSGAEDADSSSSSADDSDSPSAGNVSGDRSADDSEREASAPVVLTDGIGLPEDVTPDALVETVSRSRTIYEVKQDLGLDRDETLELLRQLDLVDVVVGRVANENERKIGPEEIVDRLREASATQP